ncbi:MAG: hypothetical protein AAFQ40_13045 [Cyanobacteria bacterium J06623_5]
MLAATTSKRKALLRVSAAYFSDLARSPKKRHAAAKETLLFKQHALFNGTRFPVFRLKTFLLLNHAKVFEDSKLLPTLLADYTLQRRDDESV